MFYLYIQATCSFFFVSLSLSLSLSLFFFFLSPFQLQDEYEYYEPESAKGSILELKARRSSVNQALQFSRNLCFFLLEKKRSCITC